MTIEQLNYLLRKELYAIKNHKDNIDRIKKEYFDSNYGLKEGDKIRILHEAGDEIPNSTRCWETGGLLK